MTSERLEAFSDGVIAILITIMVLELRPPGGTTWHDLSKLLPVFSSYVLSFVVIGIYWNNHHHMLRATQRINGTVLWANLHLLFWLSLFPFATAWMGEHHFATVPVATYGVALLLAAIAYYVLQRAIIAGEGAESTLARRSAVTRRARYRRSSTPPASASRSSTAGSRSPATSSSRSCG